MLTRIFNAEDWRFIFIWTFATVLAGMTFGKGDPKLHQLLIGGLVGTILMTIIFKLIIRPAIRRRQ